MNYIKNDIYILCNLIINNLIKKMQKCLPFFTIKIFIYLYYLYFKYLFIFFFSLCKIYHDIHIENFFQPKVISTINYYA